MVRVARIMVEDRLASTAVTEMALVAVVVCPCVLVAVVLLVLAVTENSERATLGVATTSVVPLMSSRVLELGQPTVVSSPSKVVMAGLFPVTVVSSPSKVGRPVDQAQAVRSLSKLDQAQE
jgi:hypothetical protein